MSWDGEERRSHESCFIRVSDAHLVLEALSDLKKHQEEIRARLEQIESSVAMAKGAWWFTRYVLAPLFASLVAAFVFLWDEIESAMRGC